MRGYARYLLRATWARLELACATGEVDALRLVHMGVRGATVHVTGDPGIDSAASRIAAADPQAPYRAPFQADPRPTVVAGSTWAVDDRVLLPALVAIRAEVPGLRVIIAPHEPGLEYVNELLERLRADGWSATTLGEIERRGAVVDVGAVVVDRVGVLAHLYSAASVSYVGGGFHDRGLHSVLEPAAAGSPIIFGPRHFNAPVAAALLRAGGAKIAADERELAATVKYWLGDDGSRRTAGASAIDYIDCHRGAADRTAVLLDHLMKRPDA